MPALKYAALKPQSVQCFCAVSDILLGWHYTKNVKEFNTEFLHRPLALQGRFYKGFISYSKSRETEKLAKTLVSAPGLAVHLL